MMLKPKEPPYNLLLYKLKHNNIDDRNSAFSSCGC